MAKIRGTSEIQIFHHSNDDGFYDFEYQINEFRGIYCDFLLV